MHHRATRRDALIAGLGAAALLRAPGALAQPEEEDDDAAVLAGAIALEQRAVAAYDAAGFPAAELFRDQSQEHADELIAALEELDGTAPRPPSRADVDGVGDLIELETRAVAEYYDAQRTLQSARLLQTAASIMANHAQHLVVLRQAIGENPSPDAFVTGEVVE